MQTEMLIGGKFVKGEGEGIAVLNPATGTTLATVPEASPGQVEAAVKAAQKAFDSWSQTTPVERSHLLLKLAAKIDDEAASLAKLESQNAGKPVARAPRTRCPPSPTCSGSSPVPRVACRAPPRRSTCPATPA